MRLAYFTNQYPKVSHSFIRREILALEKLGHSIERFALRSDESELVDPLDQSEFAKTSYILNESVKTIISSCFKTFTAHPIKFITTFLKAIKIGLRSDRGVIRNIAYFVEGSVLLQWQKNTNIQHIHAHFGTNSTTVAMFAYLLGGASYSFTVHGPEEFDKPEFIALAEKIKHSAFVVAISSYGRSQLFRWIEFDLWDKVKIIHCALDEGFFSEKPQADKAQPQQLICVGRLCEQKGQLLLLDAMRQLRDEGVDCQLILAGDGPMRPEVEHRIAAYQLSDKVEITGWISSEQVKTLLLASKGLVLPSFAEGLPVVIMEALALHKVVISTYVAGIPELIKHGENGWLIPAGDVEQLVSAMRELLNAKADKLAIMGQQGFNAVKAQHDVSTEAAKLATLFSEAVNNDNT